MCIIGKDEAENETLAVRTYKDGDIGTYALTDVISKVARRSKRTNTLPFNFITYNMFYHLNRILFVSVLLYCSFVLMLLRYYL